MIQTQTYLNVADNSGARKIMCIRILGGNRKFAPRGKELARVGVKEGGRGASLLEPATLRRACSELNGARGGLLTDGARSGL